MQKPKMGRPHKRSADIEKKLLTAIEKGLPFVAACNLAGICFDTFNQWRKDIPEFLERVKKAEAAAIERRVAIIEQAARDGSWQASAWLLERRHPDMFSKPEIQIAQQINVNEKDLKGGVMITPELMDQLSKDVQVFLDRRSK